MKRLGPLVASVAVACSFAMPAVASAGSGVDATDDYVETGSKVIQIYVLTNDRAAAGALDPSSLRIDQGPSNGEAVVIATGSPRIKYSAFGSEAMADTFTYTICAQGGPCDTATVTIAFRGETVVTTPPTTEEPTTTPPSTTTGPDVGPAPSPTPGIIPPVATTQIEPPDLPPVPEVTTPTLDGATTPVAPRVHPLGEMTLDRFEAVGTTIGIPSGVKLGEDVAYLGRSSLDTLALIASPTLMISGVVGFLMIGLPQNAAGSAIGFLTGFWRRKKRTPPAK